MVAEYKAHELRFMKLLRAGLDGPDSEWNQNTMLMIHELKARFPGSTLDGEEEFLLSSFADEMQDP